MTRKIIIFLAPPFFLSGFAALLYQLIWLRSLFGFYGLTYDAITVIIASFMLGLGLGSLLGGKLARHGGSKPIIYFFVLEIGIGSFGFISLHFFHWISGFTLNLDTLQLFLLSFTLFVFPTVLMGATLPLLIGYCNRYLANYGLSIGLLYCINTLGAAFACFAAALFLMNALGQQQTVWLASLINWFNAVWILCFIGHFPRVKGSNLSPEPAKPLFIILLLSALSGYLALSYEIIWLRLYSFAGKFVFYPVTLLGMYLAGLALGSFFSGYYCTWLYKKKTQFITLAIVYILIGVLNFFMLPLIAYITIDRNIIVTSIFPMVITFLFGFAFPLLFFCTQANRENNEQEFSYFYFANIIGSTAGTIITGFFLLDYLSTSWVNISLSILGLFMGILILWITPIYRQTLLGSGAAVCCLISFFVWSKPTLYDHLYDYLLHTQEPLTHLVENKSGVINVTSSKMVYGHGLYDGYYNINLREDKNAIVRAYAVSAFSENPEKVLMIGLSSGSWAQVLANHPQLKQLVIIEINPGYVQLIEKYPEVKSLLHNPKVKIIIDDGRRWLRRHPEEQFDLIVMNTTWHWREYTSYLLSVEFLKTARSALKPQGIFMYNLTGSNNALHTALFVFKHALRVYNFIVVSDAEIHLNPMRWRSILEQYQIDGRPVLNRNSLKDQALLKQLIYKAETASQEVKPWSSLFETEQGLYNSKRYPYQRIVTDDNMGDEWTPSNQ